MSENELETTVTRAQTEVLPAIVERARSMAITNAEENAHAGAFLGQIMAAKKKLMAWFDPIVTSAHATHKAATGARSAALAPIEAAEVAVKGMIAAWDRQERQARLLREDREREAARRRAEDDQIARAAALEAAGQPKAAERVLQAPVVVPQRRRPG